MLELIRFPSGEVNIFCHMLVRTANYFSQYLLCPGTKYFHNFLYVSELVKEISHTLLG